MRGMVMASQGTSGLLKMNYESVLWGSLVLTFWKWKGIGMIMSKPVVYIFEGVLKARGCMLLMLSPLSQVTWVTTYH